MVFTQLVWQQVQSSSSGCAHELRAAARGAARKVTSVPCTCTSPDTHPAAGLGQHRGQNAPAPRQEQGIALEHKHIPHLT